MEYSLLGRTGLRVSRAGFGGGGIGQVWGPTTREESVRAVRRALDLGVNYFDVAPAYGNGEAEVALGIALEGRREQAVVGTKVRVPIGDKPGLDTQEVANAVNQSVDISLRRLKMDHVDLLHLHNRFTPKRGEFQDSLVTEDVLGPVLEAYRNVQKAGKTRFIGLSAHEPHVPSLRRMMESGHFDTVLIFYHLMNTTGQVAPPPGVEIFDHGQTIPLAKSLGMGVIGIRSHAAGALTPQVDRPIAPGSDLEADVRRAGALGFLLDGPIQTLSQAAMVFSLMNQDIDTTVPGVKNVPEIEEIAGCVDLPPIPQHHLDRLAQLYARDFREE